MQSMFPEPHELGYDASLINPSSRETVFTYTIRFVHVMVDGVVPELTITYPPTYPLSAHVTFIARCPTLSRTRMEELQTELRQLAMNAVGEPVVLQLYQCMTEHLQDAIASRKEEIALAQARTETSSLATPRLLGRRAIYFHHIIASTKRRVVQEWARELRLGGFSKIGWPGVVVIEGDEQDVQEYVRRLQHLRWKQMVVRGEQTEPLGDRDLDTLRRLPHGFCEFPETAMAEAAALCRDSGLEELFLSVMKIYRSETSSTDVNSTPTETKGRKGSKQ